MDVKTAYSHWAGQYDTNQNKTRDLEAKSLRKLLARESFGKVLELGCGTGKNTIWLERCASQITSVDFSAEMLEIAQNKVKSGKTTFHQANIIEPWDFVDGEYDLVVFSLVLEHIRDLGPIFRKAAACLKRGGLVYLGELHPFKQYLGSQARFDTEEGRQLVTCFIHHVSEFVEAATINGLKLVEFHEAFDRNGNNGEIPRILNLIFLKP